MEQWKPIPGYEHSHEVSNLGRVRSLNRKVRACGNSERSVPARIMKCSASGNGYPTVQLARNGPTFTVHRLVAEAFIPRPKWATQVNHIDGDKTNNRVENLEWSTQSLNQLHAYRMGLQKPYGVGGSDHPKARAVIVEGCDGTIIGEWGCVSDCARDLGLRISCVFRVLWGQRKTHRGMIFKYADE